MLAYSLTTPFPCRPGTRNPCPAALRQQLYHANIAALFVKTYSDGSYKDDAARLAARWPLDGSAAAGGDLFCDAEARTKVVMTHQCFMLRELWAGEQMAQKLAEFRQEMAERYVLVGGGRVHRAVRVCWPICMQSCRVSASKHQLIVCMGGR